MLALTWAVLVLALYYWIHKPITPAWARAVGGALLDGLSAVILVLVAGGLGRWALRRVAVAYWSRAERVAAAALVGLCILSLAILIVGAVALTRLSMLLLWTALAALTWRDLLGWLRDLITLLRMPLPAPRWERFLAVLVLSMLLITALLALLPPTKWDVLTYHLAGPEQYAERGRFYAVPHNHFLGFPQLIETLFSSQIALTGRLTGPGALHWLIGALVLLVTGGYTARHAGPAAGWLAASILLAGASFWLEMTFAYVDLLPVGLAVIALSLTDRWHADPGSAPRDRVRTVIAVGLLAGCGLGVKYSVLWLVVSLGLLLAWLAWRDRRTLILCGAVFGAAILVAFAPWLIRNALWYANPLYPFVFEAGEMDALRQDWYSQPESGLAYSADAWQIPVLPLTATLLGVEGAGSYGTDIGPLYLVLLPLLLLARRHFSDPQREVVQRAGIVAAGVLLLWGVSAALGSYISLQTRLIFYAFGPLAIVAAITFEGLHRLPKRPFDLAFVLQAMVAMALVFTLIDAVRFVTNSGIDRYFSGKDDFEDSYLEHALGWHYVTLQQVNELPSGVTVRFLWEPRYLYCDELRITCHTDLLMDAWYYARRTIGDGSPAAIAAAWQAQGADYLLVYEFGRQFEQQHAALYSSDDWIAWGDFERQFLVEQWRTGNADDKTQYILYRWREE